MRHRLTALFLALLAVVTMLPAHAVTTHTLRLPVSITTTGSAPGESYTILLVADRSDCPMPAGSQNGVYALRADGARETDFPAISYDRMGVFSYSIYQQAGTAALKYDDTRYALTVYITQGTGGTDMSVMLTRAGDADKLDVCAFTNMYPVTVEHDPPVMKRVEGNAPAATFSFTLRPVSNTAGLSNMPMPEGSVDGVKTISTTAGVEREFGAMTFELPGEYVYRVAEVNDGQKGFKYDDSVYTLTYTVARQGDALTCDVKATRNGVEAQSLTFTNTYSGGATPTTAAPTTAAPTTTVTASPTPSPTPTRRTGGGVPVTTPASTPRPTTEITGTKVWADGNNARGVRPSGISIHLFADGAEVDATPTWTKSANAWVYSFGKLPSVDESGSPITYTVTEDSVPYYTSAVNGLTITNTLQERQPSGYTEISGTKIWKDDGAGRPSYVTVHLLRNGEAIEQRTVTAATGWSYSFERLPLDDGYGHSYTYTVREDGVPGYFARYNGFDITNTKLTKDEEAPEPVGTPDEAVQTRRTGTPLPPFADMTEEELEDLMDLLDRAPPRFGGLLATGDETPLYPFLFGGLGVLALAVLIALGRKRHKA